MLFKRKILNVLHGAAMTWQGEKLSAINNNKRTPKTVLRS